MNILNYLNFPIFFCQIMVFKAFISFLLLELLIKIDYNTFLVSVVMLYFGYWFSYFKSLTLFWLSLQSVFGFLSILYLNSIIWVYEINSYLQKLFLIRFSYLFHDFNVIGFCFLLFGFIAWMLLSYSFLSFLEMKC